MMNMKIFNPISRIAATALVSFCLGAHVFGQAQTQTETQRIEQTQALEQTQPSTDIDNAAEAQTPAPINSNDGAQNEQPSVQQVQQNRQERIQPQQVPALTDEERQLIMFRKQLAQLLTATGLPNDAQRQELAKSLEKIAEESDKLAAQAKQPRQQLEAYQNAILSDSARGQYAWTNKDEKEASYRTNRVRSRARNIKRINTPAADTIGNFWLMQADLADVNNNEQLSKANQQDQIVERMESFLRDETAEGKLRESKQQTALDPLQAAIYRDVRLALIRLYDQRGDSRKVCELIDELKQSPGGRDDRQLHRELDQWYGYCPTIGRVLDTRVKTTSGDLWSSRDRLGDVVLIHFWANWFAKSVETFEPLRAAHEKYKDQGFEIISVDLGGAEPEGKAADVVNWPICRDAPGPQTLRDLFAVQSVPRFVLIDRKGRVQHVAGSLAVLDRLPALIDQPRIDPSILAQQKLAPPNSGATANQEAPAINANQTLQIEQADGGETDRE